ncbi:hypothetical protein HZB00_00435, partial [Candidatus Woesearchaeota archaeon]|nr:hypothetical protein [Candidatus Woesearchaeota archaeon]
QKKQCCYECTNAFSQSPVAVGREAAECGKFGSAQPITSDCGDYFRQHPSSVAGCALKIRE